MATVNFSFELDTKYITRIPEKSHYNHNYYKLDYTYYGDYLPGGICNILYEENDDISDATYYALGYFENDTFVSCFKWLEDHYKEFNGI